jgi:hypothetical protein
LIPRNFRDSLAKLAGRTGICKFDPLDRDLVAQIRSKGDLILDVRSRSDESEAAQVREGGAGRRSWSSRGSARLRLTGAHLTGIPGVDSSNGLAQEHECDMRKSLGVPVRVYSGSSRISNGGTAIALRRVGAEVLGC